MGCFAAPTNGDDSSLPSLKSILATKQRGLPPLSSRKIPESKFCLISPNVFRARSKLLRVSLSFARARLRALPGSSVRPREEDEEKEKEDADICKHDDERIGCFPMLPSRQNSARFIVPVTHSGPIPSPSGELSSPTLLFPLPLPPGHTSSDSSLSHSSATDSHSLATDSHLQSPDDQPVSGPLPLPCPVNGDAVALREFSLDELAAGCQNFSYLQKLRDGASGVVYKASLKLHSDDVMETEATIARTTLCFSRKKWKAHVQSLARSAHPNLCKIIGFCYEDTNLLETEKNCKQQVRGNGFLVYESAANGSLDALMHNRGEDQPPIDWSTRMKIAIGAAEGLAFLHERGLKQVIYRYFKTNSIQLDASFNAKLCDYGLEDSCSCSEESMTTPGEVKWEALENGHVKAFGSLLEELFFAGCTISSYSRDGEPLKLAVNSCPDDAAKLVSDLAARCVVADPLLRPSMRHVAHVLRGAQTPSGPFSTRIHKKKKSFSFG